MILGLSSRTIACADERAQDSDVFGAHPEHTADAPHFDDVSAGTATVADGVRGTARFAFIGSRAGRVTPRLIAAGDGRLECAPLGRPFALRPFQALAHPSVFALSTLCSLEFFVWPADEARGRGFLKSLSDLNVARHCA